MERIDRYEVLELLGEGGAARVYRARDLRLGREVAIKLLEGASERQRARFAREARTLAQLRHPHVVAIHDAGAHEGRPYLVLDLVAGGSLGEKVRREGPLAPAAAAGVVAVIARALHAAHALGIRHRDVKPDNVLLAPHGPVLTDFGLSSLHGDHSIGTQPGTMLGTPGFMAPEQISDAAEATPRSDVFALGVTLYEVVTGRLPFAGDSLLAILQATMQGRCRPLSEVRPDAGVGLGAICARAMAVDPTRRYPTAEAMAQDLERLVAGGRPHALEESDARRGSGSDVLGALMEEPLEGPATRRRPPPPADDWGAVPVAPPEIDLTSADTRKEPPKEAEETTAELEASVPPPPPPAQEDAEAAALDETSLRVALPARGEETVVQTTPDAAKAFAERGSACFAAGDVAGAMAAFDQGLAFAPGDPELLVMRGVARRRQGNLRGALEDFDRALARSPDDARALVSRGLARAQHRDFAGAADDLGRALTLLPPGDPRKPRVLTQLERAREQIGASVIRGRRLRP